MFSDTHRGGDQCKLQNSRPHTFLVVVALNGESRLVDDTKRGRDRRSTPCKPPNDLVAGNHEERRVGEDQALHPRCSVVG